jgi:hypothetical protein
MELSGAESFRVQTVPAGVGIRRTAEGAVLQITHEVN